MGASVMAIVIVCEKSVQDGPFVVIYSDVKEKEERPTTYLTTL